MTKYVSINNKPTIEIDSSTPITTTVSGDITIDSSTAVSTDANITNTNLDVTVQGTADVNVTNATLATNATIQNATLDVNLTDLNGSLQLPVSVDNQPTVTVGNSNLDVTLQNSSINTNATIQNSALNVYSFVHDGSTWRFQLGDSSGKAIGLDHTYYTSSEITALGSSTDINLWLAAYNDSMLQNKWVASYNDEFEETVYYQHPSLGNGTKCLRLIYQYSTQNTQTVVESIVAAVADWSYSDDILGTVSVSVTNQVDPNPNNAIPVHTKVADLAFTVDTVGTATISLSGTNASLYHIYDTTTSTGFSSGTFSSSGVYELHVASDYSGSSYSHSLNVDITGDLLGATDSVTLSISGTYSGPSSFANEKYFKGSTATGTTDAVRDLVLVGANKNPFVNNSNDMPSIADDFSMSFWMQVPSTSTYFDSVIGFSGSDTRNHFKIYHLNGVLNVSFTATGSAVDYGITHSTYNTWQHFVITKKAIAPRNPNYDNTDYFLQIYINGSPQNPTVTYWDNNPAFSTTRWDTLTVSEVFISGPSRNYNTDLNWVSSKSGRQWKVEELGFYNKELSQSEVNTIYNSGVTKDLMDLASTFNLTKYFRFGDHSSDVTTTGSIQCYDEVNDTVYFEDNNGTIETHGASDTPYVPASGSWANDYYMTLANGGSLKVPITNTDLNSSHSIMFRYKSDSFTASGFTNQMFGLVNSNLSQSYGSYTRQSGLSMQLRGSDSYAGIIGTNAINYTDLPTSLDGIDDGNWHTIIMIWNSPGNQTSTTAVTANDLVSYFEIYVDSYLSSSKLSLTGPFNSQANWTWGTTINQLRLNDFINGVDEVGCAIDEVAYWRGHALTESERNLAYNNGSSVDLENTANLTTPTTYHQFEDSSNQNYDNISGSNNGTVTSGTTTAY